MRQHPRPRRAVHPAVLVLARPFFRRSETRSAFVLRLVGHRIGPVLVRRPKEVDPPSPEPPRFTHDADPQRIPPGAHQAASPRR